MLDIKRIRTNPDEVRAALKSRGKSMDSEIEEILEIDSQCRAIRTRCEEKKAERNRVSSEIPLLKKSGGDTTSVMTAMKQLSDEIKEDDAKISELEERQLRLMLELPNTPHKSVPLGADESGNIEVRRSGEPRTFEFNPKPHWEIGAALGILDPERAAKVTGARLHFVKGLGARLERAIMNFFLDTHAESGYTEILPPFLVNRASMIGTGQLPKFEEDAFHLQNADWFLIPTAEVPLTNMHRDEILRADELPLNYCAYSACFRAEAGSAGRDTRGLIRQHQFGKVELVKFAKPEESFEELERLTKDAAKVLELLELPHRIVTLCTGDMGFSSAKTYDIEVWMPSYERYVEISSCSNFEDFQARRAQIRFKDGANSGTQPVHTLNGSGVAVGRTVAAVLENYQNEDGSITVPKVLQKYIGCEKIG